MEVTIARLPKLIDGKAPMVGIPGPTAFTNLDWSFPSAGKGAVFRIPGSLTLPPANGMVGKRNGRSGTNSRPPGNYLIGLCFLHGPWWSLGRFSRLPVLVTWNVAATRQKHG
jgi:hypothetical protein